ncbi:Arc/MetJ-type ribon-helix-helix transcriptional regulator [Naumannella cuiyingiana]|uniref:Arc/MetJ-type ribon-helix-helix transcriptional regulator n=1 Tax=Naumannella cuiyingiana TaxID=1347891 RepID=A0A7Z0DAR7_9ACTN|nr:hypothetical protein [Naumannella cuiyingiana]NYI72077.1 Arc/MetJ-type ribon-helix-helix transcriptional regulator [Naumannella cuiyingiana]
MNGESGSQVGAWFAGRLPGEWFVAAPEVSVDREEIVVTGEVAAPEGVEDDAAAQAGRIRRFREDTRQQRMAIADEAEERFGRKVAWGVRCGQTSQLFTHLAVPVMTRLRQPQRKVLDTLVDAGVARSRSDALAWCVRLVGENEGEWIDRMREALAAVHEVRDSGPVGRAG